MPRTMTEPTDLLIRSGLNLNRPFTTRTAREHGLRDDALAQLIEAGLLVRPLRGCFHSAHLADSLDLRVACIGLVVPDGCVVTDRTAGWLHGASMVLAPGDHLQVPRVSVFHRPGSRLRNVVSASGERGLLRTDVMTINDIRITTPLRTACDLGRLLHRDAAFAALDGMLRLGAFSIDELTQEVTRFRGYRGVRQLRPLVPLLDPGSESYGESVLRLRWHDYGAPGHPETQVNVIAPDGTFVARVDLAVPAWLYAAEYDGAEFHRPEHAERDRRRRAKLMSLGWMVDVFRAEDVFGSRQTVGPQLRTRLGIAKVRFHAGSAD
jgi:hypothetical protein